MKPDTIWGSLKETHRRQWGHLTLVDEWSEPLTLQDQHGESYIADTKGSIHWKLLCDCGHEFTIAKSDFPGRAIARSCNRPECPYTRKPEPRRVDIGRPTIPDRGANRSIYFPNHVEDAVRAHAAQHKLSFSAAAIQLILEGALHKLVNE